MVADEYDFWLLDLDGTLVDVEEDYVRAVFDEVGDRLGREFTDREAEMLWYGLNGSRNAWLENRGIDPDAFWPVFHDVEDGERRAAHSYVHEDAQFVAGLDVPTGIVTHSRPFLANPVLDELDVRDWFDTVVFCSDDLGWKPDPRPVRRAMEELGVAHNGHVGVLAGDSSSDVGAAWNAGLDAVHVERHSPEARGHCVRADYRVSGLDELF
ncbi:MAG: HAD family hydrolase [Halobacteriales archaeon]